VKKVLGFVLALPFSVLAAEPVATATAAAAPAVSSGVAGQLTQLVLGLLLVLGLIFSSPGCCVESSRPGPPARGRSSN
jgi:hypothetical protein